MHVKLRGLVRLQSVQRYVHLGYATFLQRGGGTREARGDN